MHTRVILLAVTVMLGCTGPWQRSAADDSRHPRYDPPVLSVPRDAGALFAAVEAQASAASWSVVHRDARRGTLEAVAPLENDADFQSREHWSFHVRDGEVRVRRILEVRFAEGERWMHSGRVSSFYGYDREVAVLNSIEFHVQRGEPVLHAQQRGRPALSPPPPTAASRW